MTIQRRFAPISGRFEPESLAGLAGIYNHKGYFVHISPYKKSPLVDLSQFIGGRDVARGI